MASPETSQLLQLYQKAAPASFFEQICTEQDCHFRQRVYTLAVVCRLRDIRGPIGKTETKQSILLGSLARSTDASQRLCRLQKGAPKSASCQGEHRLTEVPHSAGLCGLTDPGGEETQQQAARQFVQAAVAVVCLDDCQPRLGAS